MARSCSAVRGLLIRGKLWLIFCVRSGRLNSTVVLGPAAALASCFGEGCEQGQGTAFSTQQLWIVGITWAL